MDVFSKSTSSRQSRIGFHYFPDTVHFREYDIQIWLPRLKDLGASWLVIQSPVDRAIPEQFIHALTSIQIEPIVQFNLSLAQPPEASELDTLMSAYANWGVHTVQLFDRPNQRQSWAVTNWAQQGLVDRFLDRYIPLAERCLKNGLVPLFPALEPGGNYWDTVFLRMSLESLERRKQTTLLRSLMLSAYGWTHQHPLNWGVGGPDRWPEARPYLSDPNQQDQRGFRIFEWYLSVAQTVLGKTCPIVLLQAGSPYDPASSTNIPLDLETHAKINLEMAHLLAGENAFEPQSPDIPLETISPDLVACNFWLLAADPHSPFRSQAWYPDDEHELPLVKKWRDWMLDPHPVQKAPQPKEIPLRKDLMTQPVQVISDHPIKHYLLLPAFDWGVSDWHLEAIRPFVKKHRPTIGFSVAEAALAERVTVVGNPQTIAEPLLESLRQTGSYVERISGDGTSIATQLAER